MAPNDDNFKVISMSENTTPEVNPYKSYWDRELIGKRVVCTVHKAGGPSDSPPIGFVVGTVMSIKTHDDGAVFYEVKMGEGLPYIFLKKKFISKVLMDDEIIPTSLGGLKRLN